MKLLIITALAGGLINAVIIALINKFAPKNAVPAQYACKEIFPKPKTIILASILATTAWLLLLALWISLIFVIIGIYNDRVVTTVFCTLIFVSLSYATTSLLLKCSHCGRRIFLQWKTEPPPYSIKYKGMTGWSSIVLQVLFKREFQCMHCGKIYGVKLPNKSQERTGQFPR